MIKDNKCNSSSTIMSSSTVNSPNLELIVKGVSLLIHSDLLEDKGKNITIPKESSLYYFCETKYIEEKQITVPFTEEHLNMLNKISTPEDISDFIAALYDKARFSSECCIISLIYINRLIYFTQIPIQPLTWRPLIFSSLLIAQKMWDDQCCTNGYFAEIYPFFTTEQVNQLEMTFLKLLQYNTHIKFSQYYQYLNIKELIPEPLPEKPMSKYDRKKLENYSQNYENNAKSKSKTSKELSESGQKTQAIIN